MFFLVRSMNGNGQPQQPALAAVAGPANPPRQPIILQHREANVTSAAGKLEKPTCLQLNTVHARQNTTSTITSDYFSMNSRENNVAPDSAGIAANAATAVPVGTR